MATNKDDKPIMTDMRETSEPTPVTSADKQRESSSTLRRDTTNPTPALRSQPSLAATGASTETSPKTSRNTSPIRPGSRSETQTPQTITRAGDLRSRNASHDTSPSRPPMLSTHSTPSAAAIQRALSATNVPQLPPGPVTEAVSRLPRSTSRAITNADNTPSIGLTSPRLKSPPPSTPVSRRNSLQRNHNSAPPITVLSSTPTSSTFAEPTKLTSPVPDHDTLRAIVKAPSRGPSGPKSNLETVQENTPPAPTVLNVSSSLSSMASHSRSSDEERGPSAQPSKGDDTTDKQAQARIDQSESDGNKSDGRGRRQHPPSMSQLKPRVVPTKTVPPLSARSRASEGTGKMTVETETVASIPQSQLSADRSGGRGEGGGSIRLKPSTETIRPRKDRKRTARKAPSIQNGTASSKADIFEARVASAVDQANSSDSDETFVYESNPPEAQHRAHRNHSRTPSNTSMHSQADRRGLRGYLDNHRVAGKRSMKFSTNSYNNLSPPDGEGGTLRAHTRHISRIGRTMGSNGSYDHIDSPFTQASKLRSNTSRQGSRPSTPTQVQRRTPSIVEQRGFRPWNKKDDLSQYDFEGDGADDERTPLVGTVRTPRNRQPRRMDSDGDYQHIYNIRQTSWMTRFGGCLLGFIVVCLVIIGAASFLVLSNKTMYDVEVRKIQNVLASEQEMVLDLLVGAVNPNVLGISITEMDVIVFAKSKHLSDPTATPTGAALPGPTGSKMRYAKRNNPKVDDTAIVGAPWQDPDGHWHDGDGELEGDSQTMLLGRILHFDQPLYFEGSPIKRHAHYSVGEMRLARPGNRTEAGGSARWEKTLQYPFELILRGVFKYSMPFSNKPQSAAMFGSVIVHPEEGLDSQGRMPLEDVNTGERWVWVEPSAAEGAIQEEVTL